MVPKTPYAELQATLALKRDNPQKFYAPTPLARSISLGFLQTLLEIASGRAAAAA
ncbi:hypothetical protein [uncultured Helicobacter sp.]|uniref:hypothetical protein n=1 Tax=uncultured Helicobacter sp. TaxID=175537 RepID=UPI0037524FB4